MGQDDEIRELERRIATGDLEAWPILDAALARAGRAPRRVWIVNDVGGHYSDAWERIDGPVHATKAGALEHMEALAASFFSTGRRGLYVRSEKDPEEFLMQKDRGRLFLTWEELVP